MSGVINYTLDRCTKCLKCIRSCPTEAIHVRNGKVVINQDNCIYCTKCINACTSKGLAVDGINLEFLNSSDYDLKIALIPSALYSMCSSLKEAQRLVAAIKKIGFDEIVDLSDIEGALYQKQIEFIDKYPDNWFVSSFCPSMNKMIRLKYPMLSSHIMPLDYPANIKAKLLKEEYKGKKIGIYYLCECAAKVRLAKHPHGSEANPIDYAVSITDIFPLIQSNLSDDLYPFEIAADGLRNSVTSTIRHQRKSQYVLAADGLEKASSALDLLEFDLLEDVRYLSLTLCLNGCIGGNLLWSNPFVGRMNVEKLLQEATKPNMILNDEKLLMKNYEVETQQKSMLDRIEEFKAVNRYLDLLPNYDCGACGYQLCSTLAHEVYANRAKIEDCVLLKGVNNES